MEPELLIADEAVSALDVSVQKQVLELLDEIRQRLNLAVLFITHDLRVAAQIRDYVAVMSKGRVVEYGSAEQGRSSARRRTSTPRRCSQRLPAATGNSESSLRPSRRPKPPRRWASFDADGSGIGGLRARESTTGSVASGHDCGLSAAGFSGQGEHRHARHPVPARAKSPFLVNGR
jgi:ABC-type multidrug transport system ATPase subunit